MNELETQFVDISEEALDELFNDTPENTVNANSLLGGKKPEKSEKSEEEKPEKPQTNVNQNLIEDVDIEEEENEDDKLKEEAAKVKGENPKETEKKKEEVKSEEDNSEDVKSALKATVNHLINSGLWQDFEGREDLEITEEVYANLVAEQDRYRVSTMFDELVDRTGPFGKAIIEFVGNGGNPDEIIDLFKEQKQIDSIKIDSVDGQREMIKHYYSEVHGWKPEKIEKFINKLIVDDELEPEAKDVKDLFSSYYKKEAERLTEEQREFDNKQKEAEKAFEQNIKTTIKDRKDLTPTERKQVEDYLLSYDQRLPNGNLVNKFYVNFAKMQANPQDYVDLVLFVMDKNKFMQKVQNQEASKATEKAFTFIKGNGAVSNKKGTTHEQIKKTEKVTSFDFGWSPKT